MQKISLPWSYERQKADREKVSPALYRHHLPLCAVGLCERHHQPHGGGVPDDDGDFRGQGGADPVRLLRRLRHHGHPRGPIRAEVLLQERHPPRARPLCRRRLPLHPGRSLPAVRFLLPLALHPDLRPGLPRDDGQSIHPLARRQGEFDAPAQPRPGVQPPRLALRHGRGLVPRAAEPAFRPARRRGTGRFQLAVRCGEGRHPAP